MKRISLQTGLRIVSMAGLILCAALAIWGVQSGIFSSQQKLEQLVAGFGILGPLLFILVQAVQVVIPIVPGGISCLAGVILFGALNGFVYNYVGICIGSVLAFGIAKSYGRPLLPKLFGQQLLDKYDGWTRQGNRFERLFALAIFLPIAPDDFLCYLAGTTSMTWKKFVLIILSGKPFAILMYSLFLNVAWTQALAWLH